MSRQLTIGVPGLGVWLLSRSDLVELNRYDSEIESAVALGDAVRARRYLEELVAHVTEHGERTEVVGRPDIALPESTSSLADLEQWLAVTPLEDGLVPD